MKLIIDTWRAAGKTTRMLNLVKEQNGVLICRDRRTADDMVNVHGLRKDQALTFEDALRLGIVRAGKKPAPLFIDDADTFIARIIGERPEGLAFSDSEPTVLIPKRPR